MRLITKSMIFIIVGVVLWLSAVKCLEFVKERYIYKFMANRIHRYVEEKWNTSVYISQIKGNIWTNLVLENLSLKNLKDYSKEMQFKADSVNISYKPFGILFGKFNADFKNCEITYGNVLLPLDIHHYGHMTTVSLKKRFLKLDPLVEILPKYIYVVGLIELDGEVILKNFSPYLLNISIKSQDCQVTYDASLKMKGSLNVEVSGKSNSPQISGDIDISHLYLSKGLSSLSSFKAPKGNLKLGFLKKSTINIDVHGKDINVKNNQLNVFLNSSIKIKKGAEENPYLLGKIDITKGTYQAYNTRFCINKGQIIFTDKNKSPLIEVEGETKVKRYKIFARIKGTLDDSQLVITSKPELTHSEIASLLVFGKKINTLTNFEKEKLTVADFNNILLNDFFFGKAEAKLAKSVGLDDINLQLDTKPDVTGKLKSPSVAVGKYIIGERLYGTYSVKPKTTYVDLPEQAISGELGLTDNITLKGERCWQESWQIPKENRLSIDFRWKF